MLTGSGFKRSILRIADRRTVTNADAIPDSADRLKTSGASVVDGEALMTMGIACFDGLTSDMEFVSTLGMQGEPSDILYGESMQCLGMVDRNGFPATVEYLSTLGVTG